MVTESTTAGTELNEWRHMMADGKGGEERSI